MKVDRREKSVEQSTNAILNPSARSENTFFRELPCSYVHLYIVVQKRPRILSLRQEGEGAVPGGGGSIKPTFEIIQRFSLDFIQI